MRQGARKLGLAQVIALGILGFACSNMAFAESEVSQPPDTLASLVEQLEETRSALRTWRSRATIQKSTRPVGQQVDPVDASEQWSQVSFVWDLTADALRITHEREAPYLVHGDDQDRQRTGIIVRKQLVKGGRLYTLDLPPAEIDPGGSRRVNISTLPEGRHEQIAFHPGNVFQSPLGVDVLRLLRDVGQRQGEARHTTAVTTDGDLVRVRFGSGDSYNEYVFDRAQGGHLVAFHAETPRPGTYPLSRHITIRYKQVGETLWVPERYEERRNTRRLAGGGERRFQLIEIVDFQDGEVNTPLDDREFTMGALGLVKGDRVYDQDTKVHDEYGTEEDAFQDFDAREAVE